MQGEVFLVKNTFKTKKFIKGSEFRLQTPYQYLHHSQQQLIYRYHIFMVPGQVNSISDNCQIISVNSNIIDIQKDLTAVKLSFVQDNLLSQHLSDYFLQELYRDHSRYSQRISLRVKFNDVSAD